MAETPWWAAAGAAAVLGAGAYYITTAVPSRRIRTVYGPSRMYRIKGRRKTEVIANVIKEDGGYRVEFDFPYGLRSERGDLFEVPPELYPEDASGFDSIEQAHAYADDQMARLPWFSVRG